MRCTRRWPTTCPVRYLRAPARAHALLLHPGWSHVPSSEIRSYSLPLMITVAEEPTLAQQADEELQQLKLWLQDPKKPRPAAMLGDARSCADAASSAAGSDEDSANSSDDEPASATGATDMEL